MKKCAYIDCTNTSFNYLCALCGLGNGPGSSLTLPPLPEVAPASALTNFKDLPGKSFLTPTFIGGQTNFNFKSRFNAHAQRYQSLLYTDYFELPESSKLYCHFTVTLAIERQKEGFKVEWNNAHLTVRTVENKHFTETHNSNAPGLHRTCALGEKWAGFATAGIEENAAGLPTDEQGVLMWKCFQSQLVNFFSPLKSIEQNTHLNEH